MVSHSNISARHRSQPWQSTPLVDGQDRSIDARSVVALITFFVVNALVIWPVYIPLLLAFSRRCNAIFDRIRPEIPPQEDGIVGSQGDAIPDNGAREDERAVAPAVTTVGEGDVADAGQPTSRCCPGRLYIPLDLRTVPVIGVLVLLASTCIPGDVVRRGIVGSGGVRPYDIMTLFICFAYISISLDASGVLRYLAFLVANRSSSAGHRLYTSFYAFFAVTGLFFGNDPLILSGTPFLAYFTDHAAIVDPTAFLFTHFQVSNLVSALLVSSNPTNLVLTSAFGISFLSYSAWLALPTVAAVVVFYPLARWGVYTRKGLIPKSIHPPPIHPRDALIDPVGAVWGASVFVVTVVVLVGLSAGGVLEGVEGVWTVTVPAAGVVFLRDAGRDWVRWRRGVTSGKSEKRAPEQSQEKTGPSPASNPSSPAREPKSKSPLTRFTTAFPTISLIISRLPFALLPFAFSFFILVEGLQHTGWIRVFGGWWAAWERVGGVAGSVWLMGVLSIIGCNVFGTNIGATILLARVLQHWATTHAVSNRSLYGAVFALAVGSNFGAYSFVFSASLAGLLWRSILAQKGVFITLTQFIRCNVLAVTVTMVVGCLVVAGEVCVMYKD